ncbi:class I SAM-dependent methyltransferase [Paenibacillus xylanivorans]|uniref:Methyltransferase n=1 Tax=Paenibacillus xylanivorans TaxID=1705561 RepID=A0A0N0C5K1_9BACL|nr:class I SAM-dependent methyltransferase [Paenibacillus xylanivorans]KOY17405.1 methyltransferase [Paenibacillus xylanivorans]
MSEYYWDNKIEYLKNTRWLYYNDDYLQFLVQFVWKIDKPLSVIDYGCGFGYLGLKLLPLLPKGSTYTGLDKGETLINEAKTIFSQLPYDTEFITCDIEDVVLERKYDIALSHAFLLHMDDSVKILQKMIESVLDGGRIICFEPHWIGNMANYHVEGVEQSEIIKLGVLQRLFEQDHIRTGKDGNIGMRLPIVMSQLGLTNVECRMSDKVNFLDQNLDSARKNILYHSLKEEGIGQDPGDSVEVTKCLSTRGITQNEAKAQYEAELTLSKVFDEESWLTYAASMKISFGTVRREGG